MWQLWWGVELAGTGLFADLKTLTNTLTPQLEPLAHPKQETSPSLLGMLEASIGLSALL